MVIAVLYRTHNISMEALPSVPRVIALLVKGLQKANPGFRFYLGCPPGHGIEGTTQVDIGTGYTTSKVYQLKRKVYRRIGMSIPGGSVNRKLVKSFFETIPEPDVIICLKIQDIELAVKYAPRAKIIWWPLGMETFDRKLYLRGIQLSDLIIFSGIVLYRYIFNLVLPTPFPTPTMVGYGPFDTSTMTEVYNKHDRASARTALGIAEDELILLHVGGTRPEKGYRVVEAALTMLPPVKQKSRLLSIGHGNASESKLKNGIVIDKRAYYPIRELYLFYIAADIGFVVPLWMEPGPMVFLDMLFFNVTVVTAYTAGIPEMMAGSDCAYKIHEPNDILQWANAIQTVVENEVLRKELAEKGRKRILEFFQEPIIEQWTKAISALSQRVK